MSPLAPIENRVSAGHRIRVLARCTEAASKDLLERFSQKERPAVEFALRTVLIQALCGVDDDETFLQQLHDNELYRWFVEGGKKIPMLLPAQYKLMKEQLAEADELQEFINAVIAATSSEQTSTGADLSYAIENWTQNNYPQRVYLTPWKHSPLIDVSIMLDFGSDNEEEVFYSDRLVKYAKAEYPNEKHKPDAVLMHGKDASFVLALRHNSVFLSMLPSEEKPYSWEEHSERLDKLLNYCQTMNPNAALQRVVMLFSNIIVVNSSNLKSLVNVLPSRFREPVFVDIPPEERLYISFPHFAALTESSVKLGCTEEPIHLNYDMEVVPQEPDSHIDLKLMCVWDEPCQFSAVQRIAERLRNLGYVAFNSAVTQKLRRLSNAD